MAQSINPLLFEGEHLVRTVEMGDEFWFVGVDVCRVLGLKNPSDAIERLDDDEKGVVTTDTLGGPQALNVLSEAGVYRLVFTSRKPVAERFKRWLAHEVIPSIRKTGAYTVQGEVCPPPPPPEKRPFPDWPLDEMRTKRGVVDMYRMLYGCMAAQWVSPQLGFPSPPLELVEHGRQYTFTLVPSQDGTV
ncbi:BRO-N domain-containing protein [Rhodovulum sp. PH10]|uniref:BRO-N domain-containing protein n=1 Tax=Rhodovulum sp. PH10 TaxID=1187851 RepID=UPI00068D17FA|nr:Bro-N domain-containing protein [Rhodovulum sp. PH10]